jgi:hypothetical protein
MVMSIKHKIINTRKQCEREEYIYFRSDSVNNLKIKFSSKSVHTDLGISIVAYKIHEANGQ